LDDDPNVTVSQVAVSGGIEVVGAVPEGLLGSALAAKLLARAIGDH
jgi:uncharacterized membrane protein YcjF (UPF0283 family)